MYTILFIRRFFLELSTTETVNLECKLFSLMFYYFISAKLKFPPSNNSIDTVIFMILLKFFVLKKYALHIEDIICLERLVILG